MRREIRAPGVAEPISHYCDAVEANGLLFVSGCPATDEHGDLVGGDDTVAQCEQVLRNLGAILAAAGCTPQDVVKVNVYLTNVDDRPLINPLRQAFFGDARPASTLVGVKELPVPGMKVEIEAVAVLPEALSAATLGVWPLTLRQAARTGFESTPMPSTSTSTR